MHHASSNRKIFWLTSIFLIVTIALGATAYRAHSIANQYRHDLENTYKHSLEELSEYTANIQNTLQKGLYVNTSKQQHNIAARLLTESNAATAAMARLPLADVQLESVNKFISQVGDFALYISSQISAGQPISDKEMQSLRDLSAYAKQIHESVQNVLTHFQSGNSDILEMSAYINRESGQEPDVNTGFKELNEIFADYPTLIYDGPFSDHITRRQPKLLENASDLTEDEQRKIAARFIGTNESSLKKVGENNGNMPISKFDMDNDTEISITKKGGYVDYMINPRHIESPTMHSSDAVNLAKEFLSAHGYNQMKESYFSSANGICTINFAYNENDIAYYSDLIKVGVALDNGQIVLFEATGYIMNHCQRDIPTNIITEQEAQQNLNPTLTVEEQSMAFSPTSGLNEVLCYEFKCRSNETGEQILIYVNAQTGMEETVFIVRTSGESSIVI